MKLPAKDKHNRGAWEGFCSNNKCECWEPNYSGACEAFDDAENWRCGTCGWPAYRHVKGE